MRKTSTGATLRHHHLGPHPLIRHYLERMNFPEIIRGCIGTGVAQSLRCACHTLSIRDRRRNPGHGVRVDAVVVEVSDGTEDAA